ncbi:hypothetical protein [Aeromicrobium stalagmiti]|uniref:hypothetical protein n=1 Tax=Aeromicrobium stalagmiti TaxID=2738988 RepID=UPI0015698859|nr:hypothetical protein [Aeromicrobium stalagmiti]NRQ51461.1 hypothetical protein [Aeromicrobium stalagmiti]
MTSGSDGLGSGKDARFHFFSRSRVPTGARFVLRGTATDAVTLAVAQLVSEGFVAREDDLDARLRQMGSPWLARAVEIGTADVSWPRQYLQDVIEDTPLIFLKRFQRKISPTLVMVAARHLPDATIELVLYPHTSRKGDPEGSFGASTRIRASVEAIVAASTANGIFVSHDTMNGIRNDGSPASQQMVRELLDWR